MNSENNNNPNNVNITEDSFFADMPALVSDSESGSEYESESESESEYEYESDVEYESPSDSEVESETDYSDMPDLISLEQLELINNLCKPFVNNQNLQNSLNEIPIYTIDSEDDSDDDFTNPS